MRNFLLAILAEMRFVLPLPDLTLDMEEPESFEHGFEPSFFQILTQCKVPPLVQHHLVQAGCTESSVFAFAFDFSSGPGGNLQ